TGPVNAKGQAAAQSAPVLGPVARECTRPAGGRFHAGAERRSAPATRLVVFVGASTGGRRRRRPRRRGRRRPRRSRRGRPRRPRRAVAVPGTHSLGLGQGRGVWEGEAIAITTTARST